MPKRKNLFTTEEKILRSSKSKRKTCGATKWVLRFIFDLIDLSFESVESGVDSHNGLRELKIFQSKLRVVFVLLFLTCSNSRENVLSKKLKLRPKVIVFLFGAFKDKTNLASIERDQQWAWSLLSSNERSSFPAGRIKLQNLHLKLLKLPPRSLHLHNLWCSYDASMDLTIV